MQPEKFMGKASEYKDTLWAEVCKMGCLYITSSTYKHSSIHLIFPNSYAYTTQTGQAGTWWGRHPTHQHISHSEFLPQGSPLDRFIGAQQYFAPTSVGHLVCRGTPPREHSYEKAAPGGNAECPYWDLHYQELRSVSNALKSVLPAPWAKCPV